VPPLAAERPVKWPPRLRRKLANGLDVVLVESHALPKISAELLFRSGEAASAHIVPGLASMTASVVRTGTATRNSKRIEEDLRRIGADLGVSSGADSSAISFSGLAEFAPKLFELVADLAQNATFPAEELERERRQTIEMLRINRTTPDFLANERLHKVLFGEHPYGTVAPSEQQVEGVKREQLQSFYGEHYRPDNAIMIAVGDFAPERMLAEIERTLGGWKAGERTAPKTPEPPKIAHRRVHFIHQPDSVQTDVLVGTRAITRKNPDWVRLGLANCIYGGAFNSRLVMNIREQKGYTYSPRSTVHGLRQLGYWTAHAAVRNDVVAASLTEIFYEMDRLRSVPVGEAELADARNYMSGVFSMGLATQDGQVGQMAVVYLNDMPEDYLETYRDKVRALTPEDVMTAARRYFDSANAQIVVVGDRGQVGEQAGLFGDLEEFDAHGNHP
jgi:predicted Zn-dependent peptidase